MRRDTLISRYPRLRRLGRRSAMRSVGRRIRCIDADRVMRELNYGT
ncbi:MAG TPA: hypothetical protein VFS75_01360 [Candidatus Paceibacterota bacterium]|nr:hypothetical protein [Candidatus Paceibacterota bacterium]